MEAVVAMDEHGGIGKDGGIPWDLPADRKLFRLLTEGKTVVMGRNTWESLPDQFRPLPNRVNMVMTRDRYWRAKGGFTLNRPYSLDLIPSDAVVIGGAQIYEALLPQIDVIYVSRVKGDFECDTFFPAMLGFTQDEGKCPFRGFDSTIWRRTS